MRLKPMVSRDLVSCLSLGGNGDSTLLKQVVSAVFHFTVLLENAHQELRTVFF
jgi:hypothetical protein